MATSNSRLRIPAGGLYTIGSDGKIEAVRSQRECGTISVKKKDMGNVWCLYGPGVKTKETSEENCMKVAAGISTIIQDELRTKTGPLGSLSFDETADGGLTIKAPNGERLSDGEMKAIDTQVVAWVKGFFSDGAKKDSKDDKPKGDSDDKPKDDKPKDDSDDKPKGDSDDKPKGDSDDKPKDDKPKDDKPKGDSDDDSDGDGSDDDGSDDDSDDDSDDSGLTPPPPPAPTAQQIADGYIAGELDPDQLAALFTPNIPPIQELPKWAGSSDD